MKLLLDAHTFLWWITDNPYALHVSKLPRHHRDPFDRLLIAQAQLEGLPVLSSDHQLANYQVEVIW